MLAHRRFPRPQEERARRGRDVPHRTRRCSSVLVIGVIVIVGGLTFFPVLALGPIVEQLGPPLSREPFGCTRPENAPQTLVEPEPSVPSRARRSTASSSSNPRTLDRQQPGDVHRAGRQRADHGPVPPGPRRRRRTPRTCSPAWWRSVCGSPCCSPTSPRRWPRAGARPRRTRCARPAAETVAHRRVADGEPSRGADRTALDDRRSCVVVPAGELIPGDGDDRRGHRHRRRVGHHRRVGAGHPRVRRRPLGGDRRHPGAVRRDRRADHRQARRDASSTG